MIKSEAEMMTMDFNITTLTFRCTYASKLKLGFRHVVMLHPGPNNTIQHKADVQGDVIDVILPQILLSVSIY